MEVKRRTLVRILRAHGVHETARGKGSHTLWELRDKKGRVLGTTTVPGYGVLMSFSGERSKRTSARNWEHDG